MGLNYKIGGPSESTWTGNFGGASQTQFDNWEIHGQTTYIQQGYPAFRSPYLGENSFTPWAQTRQTWTASAFLGLRLWDGGELYYNPELLQGFGLHNTSGAGRLSQRRSAEVEFSISALQHVAPVRAADVWLGRRAGIGRKRVRPDGPRNATYRG